MTRQMNPWWSKDAARQTDRRTRPAARRSVDAWSLRKILRLTIVLTMSFLCWMGIGCFAFEMMQLAGR
jgi:hypothetical protein